MNMPELGSSLLTIILKSTSIKHSVSARLQRFYSTALSTIYIFTVGYNRNIVNVFVRCFGGHFRKEQYLKQNGKYMKNELFDRKIFPSFFFALFSTAKIEESKCVRAHLHFWVILMYKTSFNGITLQIEPFFFLMYWPFFIKKNPTKSFIFGNNSLTVDLKTNVHKHQWWCLHLFIWDF